VKNLWITAIVNTLLLTALTSSLILNLRLITNRKTEFTRPGKIPASPLTLSDILLLGAAIALACALNQPQLLPLITVGGAITLHHLHHTNAFSHWQLNPLEFWYYTKQGLRGYLTIILPLTALALLVAGTCKLFGAKFTQPQVELFLELKNARQITHFILFAVIIAPIWEEITFRGTLYPFLKKHLPTGWAMILSSTTWAAIHLHWPVLLPFTLLGCALCLLYEKTGKLGCNIALHAIFNLTSSLLLLLLKHYGDWHTY
jgi:membrane protease YdiL (CAAX protease family)